PRPTRLCKQSSLRGIPAGESSRNCTPTAPLDSYRTHPQGRSHPSCPACHAPLLNPNHRRIHSSGRRPFIRSLASPSTLSPLTSSSAGRGVHRTKVLAAGYVGLVLT